MKKREIESLANDIHGLLHPCLTSYYANVLERTLII